MGWYRCLGGILLIWTLTETGAIDRGILEKECDRIEVKEESGLVSSYQFFDGSIESIEKICGEGLHQDEEKNVEPVYSLKAGYDLNDPSRNFDYVRGIGLNAWQAISIPRDCQVTSRVRTEWDGCVANPYIVELMESNENRKLKENSTLSIWFKWTDFGGVTTMLAMHGTDEEGGDLVVRLGSIDEKTIAFSHQYSGEPDTKFTTQANSKLTDSNWHHMVFDDGGLLLDGSKHLWTKHDANSPGFGQFDMNEVVLGGDIVEWDAGTGYKKYIRKGGFDFWGLRIFDYSMTDCEMGLLHEADFQELVKLGMIRKWSSVESWMSQGPDELSLAWIRFGIFAMTGGTTEEAAEIHNGTLTEAIYYCSGVTLPSNCLWSSKCIPEAIDSTSSTPTVTFLPPPPPPPGKTQSQINRAQEASTATTVAATSVAVTSVASVASSAATSAAISNAGTALMSSGGSQLGSVAGGVAGVGVMSVVAQLQFFNLQSQLSVNLSEKYTNMADALKWVNFEMDVGLGSQASSLEQRRRRLLDWRESVQNGLDVSQEAWARGAARLAIIGVLFVLVICVHMAILKLWGCLRPLKKRPLPASLVFPRIELLICSATYLSIAESVGLLLASQKQVAVYAGLLAFLYLGLLTGGHALWQSGKSVDLEWRRLFRDSADAVAVP